MSEHEFGNVHVHRCESGQKESNNVHVSRHGGE